MLIVLLTIGIALIILDVIISRKNDECIGICGIGAVVGVISIIGMLICAGILVNGRTIDLKIDMYTEENTKIETQIDNIVTNYMEFESKTLTDLKGESAIALVSLYPELKSDELVKTQIETYTRNNKIIKSLKEDKIRLSNVKWWLYFGK